LEKVIGYAKQFNFGVGINTLISLRYVQIF
jgi:hypothetical protein